jgi:hypothetical protein
MNETWKANEVVAPAHLTALEVGRFVDAKCGLQPRGDWRKWSASYLSGRPAS